MFRISASALLLVAVAVTVLAAEELRSWKDTTGTFSIDARFVKLADSVVQLEMADGKVMKIPLDKLSTADAKLAQELAAKAAPAAATPDVAPAEMRTWSDATGKFTLQGKFEKLDGDTVYLLDAAEKSMKIPLSRLSAADQEYVKARPVANPFEDLGSAGKATGKAAAPGKVFVGDKPGPARIIRPDWSKGKILMPNLAGGKWKVTVPEFVPPKPLEQAPRIEPALQAEERWERLYSLRVSEAKQRVILCLHGVVTSITRLLLYDATNGQQLGAANLEGKFNLLDISDDGEQLLMGGSDYRDRDFTEIWRLGPKGIVRERGWSNQRDTRD